MLCKEPNAAYKSFHQLLLHQADLELIGITQDCILLRFQFVDIPVRPQKPPFQEIGFGAAQPNGKMSREIHCVLISIFSLPCRSEGSTHANRMRTDLPSIPARP